MKEGKLPILIFNIYRDGQLLRTERFQQEVIKIGRTATSHIAIEDDDMVSKMHVVIDVKGVEEVELIDLGSVQGTYVNGKKVNKCYLRSGDEIQVGNTKLIVEIEEEEEEGITEVAKSSPVRGEEGAPRSDVKVVPPSVVGVGYVGGMYGYGMPTYPAVQMEYDPVTELVMEEKVDVGGLVNINEIEGVGDVIEVVSIWRGTILDVRHLGMDKGAKKGGGEIAYVVGEDPKCDFYVSPEVIGGRDKFELIRMSDGGVELYIIGGMKVKEVDDEGARHEVGEGSLEGVGGEVKRIRYERGKRILIEAGEVSWFVHSVREGRVPRAPLDVDWNNTIYGGIATVVHIIILVLINFIPPDPQSLSLDVLAEENRFVRYILEPPEMQQEEVPEWFNKDKKDEESGGKGKRHKGEEGQMGDPNAPVTGKRYGIKGPADNPNPRMARSEAREYAMSSGILSVLRSAAPTSPFGADSALGNDPENALGLMMGNEIGASFGYGGLGLRGTGRGGGGTGEGTIGLGNLATIGHGGGGGSGQGYGRGAGGLRGRGGIVPTIKSGVANVRGALAKEVIRRYIHMNMNKIKFCYEQKLRVRPDLTGRVAIRFIIGPDGTVTNSIVEQSETNLGDPEVENCVAQVVSRIIFPAPEGGGIVIVTYPFVFQPAE